MKLNYQTFGTGRPLIILHGLFGSSDNWRNIAKQMAEKALIIAVDLRNHGRSPHSVEQTYALMADDLFELLNDLNLDKVDMIGHSMGGKVAMAFSQYYPQRLNKLVVVDIAPRAYMDGHSEIFRSLLAIDLSLYATRNEVDDVLKKTLTDKAVRLFLLMNLELRNGQLCWRINLQGLNDTYPHMLKAVCEDEMIMLPICFIRGELSTYIIDEDEDLIRAIYPYSEIYTIEQAGHWLHADKPQQFLTKISEFFEYA